MGLKSIRLNLGIKGVIRGKLLAPLERVLDSFDSNVIHPLYNLLNLYLTARIGHHYGADYRSRDFKSHNIDYGTGNLGYGLLHYSFVRNIRPRRILCIGSMYGFIPFMCAAACRQNGTGVVDFVDAGYDIDNPKDIKRHNFGTGFWRKVKPKKHFSFLKTQQHINPYIMTSKEFSKKFSKRNYDYIYIDGDHSYEGVRLDYKLFWPRLKKGGFMAFHDTDNKGRHGNLFYNVDSFCKQYIFPKKKFLHFPNRSSGLVIVQKS